MRQGDRELSRGSRIIDIVMLFVACTILLYGVVQQFARVDSDAAKYQCYVTEFWQGTHALSTLPEAQCAFITHPTQQTETLTQAMILQKMQKVGVPAPVLVVVAAQASKEPYHALPHEYPLLTLVIFSAGLFAPVGWYQLALALLMACVVMVLYWLLLSTGSRGAAGAYLFYLTLGNFSTAFGRFDLVPSALTVLVLLGAERKRWNWAFALLAVATLLKFYPAILIIPLFMAQQMQYKKKWYAWERFWGCGIFIGVCACVTMFSLLLSVDRTLAPFSYFGVRPIQVESTSASMLWASSLFTGETLRYAYAFGSRSVFGMFSAFVAESGTILSIAGIIYVCWLQWRGKITLALAMLLLLLVIIVTGKVFSAQYLIWVTPFVAYVGGWSWKWLVGWGSVCLVTTLIYPFLYYREDFFFGAVLPEFHVTIFVRNILLLGVTGVMLVWASRKGPGEVKRL